MENSGVMAQGLHLYSHVKSFKEEEEVGNEPERFKHAVFEGYAGTFGFLPAAIAMDDRQPSCTCFNRSDAKRFGKM